ncbi:MAG: hypothetical protein K2Y51_11760 [Gammaproteobacteria bacterium]|nr:hypothetical protein [Gammaproteobacteria bacterium]
MASDPNETVAKGIGGPGVAGVHRLVRRRAPIPVALWPLSGSYVGVGEGYRLELMLDIDSASSIAQVTLDFYGRDGEPGSHIGACTLRAATIANEQARTVIRGRGRFTFPAAAPLIEIAIERRSVLRSRAPARVEFYSDLLCPGAQYLCEFRGHATSARGWEASPVCTVLPFARPTEGRQD